MPKKQTLSIKEIKRLFLAEGERAAKKRKKFQERLLKNETPSERKAYELLLGFRTKVEKQKIFKASNKKVYFLDFYLPYYKLGIEIDGGVHHARGSRDLERDLAIMKYGVAVIRFTNEEILHKQAYFIKAVGDMLKVRTNWLNCSEKGRELLDENDRNLEKLGEWNRLYDFNNVLEPIILKDKYAFLADEREDVLKCFVLD